jgi:hypothetical protein
MATYFVKTTGNDSNAGTESSPFASWAKGFAVLANDDTLNIQAGTYTLTSSTPGANGGPATIGSVRALIQGYETTPGDSGAKPLLTPGAVQNVTLVTSTGISTPASQTFRRLSVDGQSNEGVNGFRNAQTTPFQKFVECEAKNCNSLSINWGFDNGRLFGCSAVNCTTGFIRTSFADRCLAFQCTSHGFVTAMVNGFLSSCVSAANGGDGFQIQQLRTSVSGCVSYGNASAGLSALVNDQAVFIANSVFVNNQGPGIALTATNGGSVSVGSAFFGNEEIMSGAGLMLNNILLDGDPFVGAESGDFGLNADAGQVLREVSERIEGTSIYPFGRLWTGIGGTAGFSGIGRQRRLGT